MLPGVSKKDRIQLFLQAGFSREELPVEGPVPSWTVFLNGEGTRGQKDQNGSSSVKAGALSIEHNKLSRLMMRHSHEGRKIRRKEEEPGSGFQGSAEKTIKIIGNPIRGQITKGPLQGAKSGRLPRTAQIPGTQAAGLDSGIHRSRSEKPRARGNEGPTRVTAIHEGFDTLEGRQLSPKWYF